MAKRYQLQGPGCQAGAPDCFIPHPGIRAGLDGKALSKRSKRHDWSEQEEKPEPPPEREKDWAREFNPPMGPYLGDWRIDGKLHNPPTGVCAWIAGSEAPFVFAGEEEKRKRGPVQT